MSVINLTPEVQMNSNILYLVRVDKEEVCFCSTEKEAILVIDSLAAAVQKEMVNEYTKVFREDDKEGEKVILFTQSIGFIMNGTIQQAKIFDYVPVSQSTYVKGRHPSLDSSEKNPAKDFIPFPDVFENLLSPQVIENNDLPVNTSIDSEPDTE